MVLNHYTAEKLSQPETIALKAVYEVETDEPFELGSFDLVRKRSSEMFIAVRTLRGSGTLILDETVIPLETNGLVFHEINSVCRIFSDCERCKFVVFEFKKVTTRFRMGKHYNLPLTSEEIIHGEMLLDTLSKPFEQRFKYASAIFTVMMVNWYIQYTEQTKNNSQKRVEAVIERIKRYPEEDYNISDEAEKCRLSERRFRDVFMTETGLSPKEFMIKERLNKAIALLILTNKKMADIAIECGYADPLYFSRIFKSKTGYSPMEFRERLR